MSLNGNFLSGSIFVNFNFFISNSFLSTYADNLSEGLYRLTVVEGPNLADIESLNIDDLRNDPDVCITLEDNIYLDRGVPARNEQLVERVVGIIERMGGRVLTPAEARAKLNLKKI